MRWFLLLLLLLCCGRAAAGTVVHLGSIKQFTGPADPNIDLTGQFDYAINFNDDVQNRTVNGLQFKLDTPAPPGTSFIGPQNVVAWQAKPEYGASADANSLEEIMHDIRWANASVAEKLQATLAVAPGIPYKLQILIGGNNPENRNWDIRFNGQQAVDEIGSLGAQPGSTYGSNRSMLWEHTFTPAATPITVEMGDFFGANDGGDRNPIWQAMTLERVYIPPTPDDITLSPAQFFPTQTAYIGNLSVVDGKFGATHTLSFVSGAGDADNAKFTLSGGQLLPSPFNFSTQPPGTNYNIRVRAVDAADAARFLEKPLTVSLVAPSAPSAVTLDAASLSAGLIAGQLAGVISAADTNAFDRHFFALVSGAGSTDNGRFTVTGNELRLTTALPVGTTSVSIRLRATDLSGLTAESVIVLPVQEALVRINEVMSVSTAASLPRDENNLPQDWIEFYNELPQPVSLAGWRLTDDPDVLNKWTFPASATIAPNGYFLVFASGSGATPAGKPPNTNFSLSQTDERLILSRPDGMVVSDFNPPEMFPKATWGVRGGGTELGYLRTPTPNALNSQLAAAGRNDVTFSVPHGFKTAAFPLTLTATIPGSVIRYTLDGGPPTASSPVYAAPLNLTPVPGTVRSGTRTVRAFATHADAAYTPVVTQTYLFVNGIANPNTDGIVGQANLIASIKTHPTYGPLIDDALLALSAMCITNSSGDLPYAEIESSMELFDPAGGEPGFTIPAGIIRSGTTSLGYAKGSMSARFRGEYGATKLIYPVYGRHPHDALGAVTEFNELRLRSGSHDTHSWIASPSQPGTGYGSPPIQRDGDAQYIRNIWIEDMQLLMGQPGKHGRMVNMFFNGNYYGMYHIQEHADDDYMGTYYPGNSEDYHFTGAAVTGSTHGAETWRTPWNQMKASLSNYTEAKRWVDVTNLADYMVLAFYTGNDWDWSSQHNWGAAGPRLPDWGGWKFFCQDSDISLQDVNADCTDQGVPDGIFVALMAHADFKVLFRDRIYRHMFHDGVLTPAKITASYNLRANEIFTAIVAETARWQPGATAGPAPWDRDGEWMAEKNYLTNTYFTQRPAIQMNQFRARGWYPVDAPEMNQWGGAVNAGQQITLTGPAASTIYYTLDGSDPRLPGGAVSPAAIAYSGTSSTQTLIAPYNDVPGQGALWKYFVSATAPPATWKDNSFNDAAWPQGAAELGYGDGDEVTNVGFADTDPVTAGNQRNITTYFRTTISIANPSAFTGLNLRLKRDDGAVVYINGQEVWRSNMPTTGAITSTTPATAASDDGETWQTLALTPARYTLNAGNNTVGVEIHQSGSTSSDITFDLELTGNITVVPQPIVINGPGTLNARAKVGAEWSAVNEATFYLTGTQTAGTSNITLSEIHYNPEGSGQGDCEFIEFHNTGASAVNMDGVQIGGAVVFTFPSGIILLPGEHVVVVKDMALFDARYRAGGSPWHHLGIRVAGAWSGSLSNGGEQIIVLAADNSPIYTFTYDDEGTWPGRADGGGSSLELENPAAAPATLSEKQTHFNTSASWRPSSEFHGSPGRAGSGPDQRVVINEVLSASLAPQVDFIELLNVSGVSQSVGGWFLSDSGDDYRKFKIPTGTSLLHGAYLVLNETHFNNDTNPGSLVPFSLNSTSDDVYLLEADSSGNLLKFADRVEFSSAPGNMTYGRSPNGNGSFDLLRGLTQGSANTLALPQYASWVAAEFPTGSSTALTALTADPDLDGFDNLAEFAFRTNPLAANGNPLSVTPAAGGSPLQAGFSLRNDVLGLTARFDLSGDLATWDISESLIQRLPVVIQPGNMDYISARIDSAAPGARRFLRVLLGL